MRMHKRREDPLCTRKRFVRDELTARAQAMRACRGFDRECMSVYRCGHCGGFHVTSKAGTLANRVTAVMPFMQIRRVV